MIRNREEKICNMNPAVISANYCKVQQTKTSNSRDKLYNASKKTSSIKDKVNTTYTYKMQKLKK